MKGALFAAVAATVAAAALAACSPTPSGSAPSKPTTTATPGSEAATPSRTAPVSRPLHVTARVARWRLPGPLSRGVAMTYHTHVLLAGGLEPGDTSTDQVLRVQPSRGVVSHWGRLAEPMHDSAGAVLRGRPTVVGGGGAVELSGVQRMVRDGRWRMVGQLPGARSDLSVATSPGGLLVIGGYDGVHTPTAVLRTRNGSHFVRAGRLPYGVRYAGVARVGSAVWVIGGEVNDRELGEVLRIDVRSGRVRSVARTPRPLGHEAVAAVGDRLLVMGGRTAPEAVTDRMWWFDLRTHRWSHAGKLPYPVADAPSVTVGSHAFLFGGETPGFTARVTRVGWR